MNRSPYKLKPGTEINGDHRRSTYIDLNVGITHWNKTFYAYAKGYKDAADFLVQGAVNGSRHFNFQINELVFPIAFLYRQYLELRLKDIIVLSNRLNNKSPRLPFDLQKDHSINKLWSHAKPLIEAVSSNVPRKDLNAVDKLVKYFAAIDPTGMAFRYPINKKGQFHLPELAINLRQLRKTMQKIGSFLDGYSEYFEVLWQEAQWVRDSY